MVRIATEDVVPTLAWASLHGVAVCEECCEEARDIELARKTAELPPYGTRRMFQARVGQWLGVSHALVQLPAWSGRRT